MKINFTQNFTRCFVICFLFLVLFLQSKQINAQPTSQTFNSSGTYTVPPGYSATVTIEAWGAGGGGGTNSGNAKGGGGGGAFASIITTLNPGSYTVTVGTGGTPGNAGGSSSFSTLVIAAGGSSTSSSTGGAGGTIAASTGTTLYAGGDGGNGASTTGVRGGGGGGGSANTGSNGGNGGNGVAGSPGTGGSGGSGTGNGGHGADDDGTPDAAAGISPGGGGGGKGNNGNSQAGADGRVIVTLITILPVKFGDLNVLEKENGIQLEWNTYSEINTDHFEIQRSETGSIWSSIGEETAKNQVTGSNYSYFDPLPNTGTNFYRIKSIYKSGRSDYSTITKINLLKIKSGLGVYPNPVTEKRFLFSWGDLPKGDYKFLLISNSGQVVFSRTLKYSGGNNNQVIQLPASLQTGMYSLNLTNNTVKENKLLIIY